MIKRLFLLALSWCNRPHQIALTCQPHWHWSDTETAALSQRHSFYVSNNGSLSQLATRRPGDSGRTGSLSRWCRPAGVVWDRKLTLTGKQAKVTSTGVAWSHNANCVVIVGLLHAVLLVRLLSESMYCLIHILSTNLHASIFHCKSKNSMTLKLSSFPV